MKPNAMELPTNGKTLQALLNCGDQCELADQRTYRELILTGTIRALLKICYFIIAAVTRFADTLAELLPLTDSQTNASVLCKCGTPVRNPKRITFSDLPQDILVHMFDIMLEDPLHEVSATCLGLTCSSFYRIFKKFYPTPIALSASSGVALKNNRKSHSRRIDGWVGMPWPSWSEVTLADLISSFIGPGYRSINLGPWEDIFVSTKVYDEYPGLAEERLRQRHNDYDKMLRRHSGGMIPYHAWRKPEVFPSPWTCSADEWYAKVEAVVQGLERDLEAGSGSTRDFNRLVETHFYAQRLEDQVWQGFREWAELVNI